MNLTKTSFPLGWTPSADSVNGNSNGLLRMDNLQQEEEGVLSLVRGIQQIDSGGLGNYPADIYSKVIDGQEVLWAGLTTSGIAVLRSKAGNFSDSVTVCNGTDRAIFGDCLGQVLVCAGNQRKKDNGTSITNLGIVTPPSFGPGITVNAQPILDLTAGTWQSLEGHDFSVAGGSALENVDTATLRGVVLMTYAGPINTNSIGDGPQDNPANDIFYFLAQLHDSSLFTTIRLEVILDDDPTTNVQNYYWIEFPLGTSTEYILGIDQQSVLSARRGDFTRQGDDTTLDWSHVTGIRITALATADTWFLVGEQRYVGGIKGSLNGAYSYLEVHVADNGFYVAKSEASPGSGTQIILNGSATIDPGGASDPQVTAIWLYRRSINTPRTDFPFNGPNQAVPSTNPNIPVSGLNDWYFVGSTPPGTPFLDDVSDEDALQINIKANLFLQSLQNVPDTIIGMEGLFNERMLYLTTSSIFLSDQLNPDAIDQRYTLKAFGDPTEKNLWIKKLTNNVLILATTKNLYEISGTLLVLPDGTVDATFIPIGENYPPLSNDVASVDGRLFYVAADGVRVTTGSNSTPVSPQLNLLFQGLNRHGIPPVAIYPNNNSRYSIAVCKAKLYVSVPCQNTYDRLLFVLDIINNRWTVRITDPIALYATQSDRLLIGYGYEPHIYEVDKNLGITDSSGALIQGQTFYLQTVFDANGQPRNRKDTFTLKVICDTGGKSVDVYIGKDSDTEVMSYVGSITSSGINTSYFPLDSFTLGFRYALRINANGADVSNLPTVFKLQELTIEYDARPEQLDYLRIPNTNLNSYARKRVTSFAYVIDTLGNTITFTPYIDNVPGIADSVNNPVKLTHITFFDQETIGTDIGGIFSGGVFEYYGVNLEETVSEKLPTPTRYLVIPNNDYGTPNRKRHTSYKFQINTRGQNVVFTPRLDGVNYATATFNTTEKRVVEYFFDTTLGDIIGIDIGGTLDSATTTPFEFYGIVTPQQIETLPPRLTFFRIPNTNYGVASRKRIRTIPIIIDTYGSPVTFTPILDGVLQSNSTTFSSNGKTTLYHYFIDDVFPTDIGGQLKSENSAQPFEFYELGQPENVEVLPVPKQFDQIGPIRFDKIGKLFDIRTRIISLGDLTIPYTIYRDNDTVATNINPLLSGVIPVQPFVDQVWQTQLPKSINGTVFRIVLGPTEFPFHRYDMQLRVKTSGMQTDSKWMPAR